MEVSRVLKSHENILEIEGVKEKCKLIWPWRLSNRNIAGVSWLRTRDVQWPRKEKEKCGFLDLDSSHWSIGCKRLRLKLHAKNTKEWLGGQFPYLLYFCDVFLYHIFFALQSLTSTTRINDNAPVTIWAFFVQSGFYCWWVHFWLYDAVDFYIKILDMIKKLDLSLKLCFQWDLEAHTKTKTLIWIRRRKKRVLWSINGLFPPDCYPQATPLTNKSFIWTSNNHKCHVSMFDFRC